MVVVVLCCLGIEVGGFEYLLHTEGILLIQGWLNLQMQNLEITDTDPVSPVTGTPQNERHEGSFGAFTRYFLVFVVNDLLWLTTSCLCLSGLTPGRWPLASLFST